MEKKKKETPAESASKSTKIIVPTKTAEIKKVTLKKEPVKRTAKVKAIIGTAHVAEHVYGKVLPFSRFTEFDISLFQAGKHHKLYNHFGSHYTELNGVEGMYFAVWAPNAEGVSVIGNFNYWNADDAILFSRWDSSGIWEGFVPGVKKGEAYKYSIRASEGRVLEKADPFARFWETRPKTATITWDTDYQWNDAQWMKDRAEVNSLNAPFSVYEVHLGSWMRNAENPEVFLTYLELADKLVSYVKEMEFTHVEFMPVMEFPFDGSWGYQGVGYFAPTARFGSPQDFMFLMDSFHQAGIAVILDWVPAHFPGDAHGLYEFDGTHLYEHDDPRKGFHPDWKSYIFNLGRNEVRSFMLSSAMFWMEVCHVDGLRVDAVASMLYLDYSRNEGEWIPNEFGGRENLENVSFLKELNEMAYSNFSGVQTIAEESTSWPGVSRPTYTGGLGFGMKWMMGWMNDSLRYFERDPYYRQFHQNEITFSLIYAFTENFMLPFSHDEVVHGKQSLVYKMPGDDWQRFANLRLLYLWMFTHPGTKLLFQGCEFAQTAEWNHEQSLDWHLLQFAPHNGMQRFVKGLNHMYRSENALFEKQFEATGFEWIDASDHGNSILIYMRKGNIESENLVIALNLTPIPHTEYRIGLPSSGEWNEVINSDDISFYGSGVLNGVVSAEAIPWQGKQFSATINLPPLGGTVLKAIDLTDGGL